MEVEKKLELDANGKNTWGGHGVRSKYTSQLFEINHFSSLVLHVGGGYNAFQSVYANMVVVHVCDMCEKCIR